MVNRKLKRSMFFNVASCWPGFPLMHFALPRRNETVVSGGHFHEQVLVEES